MRTAVEVEIDVVPVDVNDNNAVWGVLRTKDSHKPIDTNSVVIAKIQIKEFMAMYYYYKSQYAWSWCVFRYEDMVVLT